MLTVLLWGEGYCFGKPKFKIQNVENYTEFCMGMQMTELLFL
jgi:hypothetical protein